MPALREATTAIIARGDTWAGAFATEPYEAAWATEALVFLRLLKADGPLAGLTAAVQISPDGQHWADEGTVVALPEKTGQATFAKVTHFGNWLRLAGTLPPGTSCQVAATLSLKG
jgi:hypothetical protein